MAKLSRREFLTQFAGAAGIAGTAALSGCAQEAASGAQAAAQPWDLCWSRLPLEGSVNTRELGGYPTSMGGHTNYHAFLRSDDLSRLSEADVEFLRNYGVSLVVDLRSEDYFLNEPDRSLGSDVPIVNVPLFELLTDEDVQLYNELIDAGVYYIERTYDFVFANEARIRECFETMAAAEGCVLFHCQIGKDRTGITAALLMQLAGCDDEDILSNYMVSRVNLTRDPSYRSTWESDLSDQSRSQYESAVSSGEYILARIAERGGARQFLLDCGVSEQSLERLRAKLAG